MEASHRADQIAALKAEFRAIFNEDPFNLEWNLERLDQLSWSVGAGLYSNLFLLLCNLDFEEDEARRHWHAILGHREALEQTLGRSVALRVAVFDYLVTLNRSTSRARLLEVHETQRPVDHELTDPLTHLNSTAFFNDQLPRELGRARRYDLSLSLIHIEIDDYPVLIERFGQSIGSVLLKEIAGIITRCIRTMDYAARISAAQFALLLTETDRMGAYYLADRIRQKVEEFYLERQIDGRPFEITVSSGVAAFPQDADDAQDLVRRASAAFNTARSRGLGSVAIHYRERREYIRLDTPSENLQVTLIPEGDAARALTEMKNISSGGVLFESDDPIDLGRMVQITCLNERERDEVLIPGHVVRIERFEAESGPRYEIGVLFDLVVEEQLEGVIGFLERFITPDEPTDDAGAASSSDTSGTP
jgi:diguanylate cyclase (GGDEF)-like protein